MAYPEILQVFNDEIYPVRISVRKSLIKVAIYEIYGMKWGPGSPNLRLGGHGPPLATPTSAVRGEFESHPSLAYRLEKHIMKLLHKDEHEISSVTNKAQKTCLACF